MIAVYFASAFLVTAPPTPLTLKHAPKAYDVIDPLFSQNWQLFAPDPISEERGIIARVECSDGTVTEYQDITTPLIDKVQSGRPFPSRQSRMISNGILQVFLEDPYLLRLREHLHQSAGAEENLEDMESSESPNPEAIVDGDFPLTEQEREVRRRGELVLINLAATELADQCVAVEAVQLRYVLNKFPRWSQRNDPDAQGDVNVLESEWKKPS